jgi:hypothetical protein
LDKVQHVVDELQQVLAAAQDMPDEGPVLRRARADHAVVQQLAEADDGVQRRAQLVAHVGQEGALQAAGFLDAAVLEFQLGAARLQGFGALALGDVAHRGQVGPLVVPFHAHHAHFADAFAIGARDVDFSGHVVGHRKAQRLALQVLAAAAEEVHRRLVDVQHHAGVVDDQDGVGRGVQHALELSLLFASPLDDVRDAAPEQPRVGLFLGKDVLGALGDGLRTQVLVHHAGDHHDGGLRQHHPDAAHGFHAAGIRQVEIQDDDVDRPRRQQQQRFRQRAGAQHLEGLRGRAGQALAGQLGVAGAVFDEQDTALHGGHRVRVASGQAGIGPPVQIDGTGVPNMPSRRARSSSKV